MPASPADATLELLERLVAIDSTSATASNTGVIDLCAEVLDEHGAWVERVDAEPHDWDGGQLPKQGLLARIGPDVDGGVVLSGHTDCVPVVDQPWTTDPFTLTERDGVLVGRGTTDMKGFLASALAVAAPAAAAAALARPLWLLLTWDEELGTIGARPMTEALVARTRPRCAIVGEPTGLRPAVAHKGVRSVTATVRGSEGHSSRPDRFANALVAAARIACHADDVAQRLAAEAGAPMFDPPYTTFGITVLRSGSAINIIPAEAHLQFEYRPVPADDGWELAEEVIAWAEQHVVAPLRAKAPGAGIDWQRGPVVRPLATETEPAGSYEGVASEDRVAADGGHGAAGAVTEAGAAERLVRDLTGFSGEAGTVPFGTDGGWHQAAGISTVVCGPGEIAQAHQPDEWIDPAQLAACDRMLAGLVTHLEHGGVRP